MKVLKEIGKTNQTEHAMWCQVQYPIKVPSTCKSVGFDKIVSVLLYPAKLESDFLFIKQTPMAKDR